MILLVLAFESLGGYGPADVVFTAFYKVLLLSFLHFHYKLMAGRRSAGDVISQTSSTDLFVRVFGICETQADDVAEFRVAGENTVEQFQQERFRNVFSAENKFETLVQKRVDYLHGRVMISLN